MDEQPRKHREVSYVVGDISPTPPSGQAAESMLWIRIEGSEVTPSPYRELRLRYELRDGTWICTGLHLETEEKLTAQEITERLPFAALARLAVEIAATATDTPPPRITAPRRRGRHGLSNEFLAEVAALYRYANARKLPPIPFIQSQGLWEHGHEPHEDTVRHWIRRARKRELLGPSMHGKAGELPLDDGRGDA